MKKFRAELRERAYLLALSSEYFVFLFPIKTNSENYNSIIVPVILYRCEFHSGTHRFYHGMRVFRKPT